MVSISLPLSVAYSLIISGALAWLNKTDRGLSAGALVTLAICVAIGLLQLWASRSAPVVPPFFSLWLLSVLAPGAAVFAVSVLPFVLARPWSLLLLGPLSFLIGMIVAMTFFNIQAGPNRTP
jgi:hypothetical protein